jgi:hypothetical protein
MEIRSLAIGFKMEGRTTILEPTGNNIASSWKHRIISCADNDQKFHHQFSWGHYESNNDYVLFDIIIEKCTLTVFDSQRRPQEHIQ